MSAQSRNTAVVGGVAFVVRGTLIPVDAAHANKTFRGYLPRPRSYGMQRVYEASVPVLNGRPQSDEADTLHSWNITD